MNSDKILKKTLYGHGSVHILYYYMTFNVFTDWLTSLVAFFDKTL